jgi:hypothetical protein
VEIDEDNLDALRVAAVMWFNAATAALDGALMPEERAKGVCSVFVPRGSCGLSAAT